jgi:L-fucose isomerase-like protein
MDAITVKIGFVPTYRFSFSPWCEQMRRQSIEALRSAEGLDLVVPQEGEGVDAPAGATPHGCVHTLDEAEAVARDFQAQGVEGLIICPLDFGDERSAAKVAELLDVPILLYATKEPPARTDKSLARVSDAYCGNLSIAAALYRRKLPFRWAGLFFPDEPGLLEEVREFVAAVAVVSGLTGARIGQVGLRPEPFESCEFSERAMITRFGQTLVPREVWQIVRVANEFADDADVVKECVERIRSGVAEMQVSDEHLLRAARLELALLEFARSKRLSAMAVQCWPSIQGEMGISVCAILGRLTERGVLTACEADVIGALTMLAQHRAVLGRTVPHFIDWTIQHREDPNMLLAWHCGNAPVCLAAHAGKAALRSRGDMVGESEPQFGGQEGLYQFQIRPGEVTICRLAEYDGEWKMLIASGEIVSSDEELAGTWSWVRVSDHARLYRTLVEEGFIHHASMIHGDLRRVLQEACRFLGVRPVVVE